MKTRGPDGARNLTRSVVAALACICHGSNVFGADAQAIDRTGPSAPIRSFPFALPPYARSWRDGGRLVASHQQSNRPATTREVTNCDDSGSGSLRDTIASAVSGDTVDLSQLTCSTITLTSSYLTVLQDDLTITGPGATSLAIDGAGARPLFAVYGSGTFSIDDLTLTNGYYYYHGTLNAAGGCIASSANVVIQNSIVSNCTLKGYKVHGGAIWTLGNLTVNNSVITDNQVLGTYRAGSGAALVYGDLTIQYSTISNNTVSSTSPYAFAGAFEGEGNLRIQNSTISGNHAKGFGAFWLVSHDNSPRALIVNSTISDNVADSNAFGAGYSNMPLTIYNSTIAFNTSPGIGGVYVYNAPLILQSTIIADNAGGDLGLGGTATVSGANNLIVNAILVPPDTIRDCPQLGPLAHNGGVTLTHAPRSTSSAIDSGSNLNATSYDQRGMGFPRVFGLAADIGAVEWQGGIDDSLFDSGFESGCDR